MFALRVSQVSVLIFVLAPTLSAVEQRTAAGDFYRDYATISRFLKAVDEHVVQHHRLFEPLSEEIMCLPEDTLAAINALVEVPRVARPALREGAIFRPDVADLFRHRIATTFRRHEFNRARLLAEMDEDDLVAPPVLVNEPLPWGMGNVKWPLLVDALPPLPEELAYRLVGRNLVLIDVESDLVVDVLRAALPIY